MGALPIVCFLFCITVSNALYRYAGTDQATCPFSLEARTDDPRDTMPIGQLLRVNITINPKCRDTLEFRFSAPWATNLSTSIAIDQSYADPMKQSQTGGFTKGFALRLQQSTLFSMWPIDRSIWQRNHTFFLYVTNLRDTNQTGNWSYDMVSQRLLNNLTCNNPSPLPNGNLTINCTLIPANNYNQTAMMTLYNAALYFRIGTVNSLLQLGDFNVTGVQQKTFTLSPSSIPQGPLPVQVHVWIGYDSYTTSPSLPNYPQRNYLSANLDKTSGSIVSFNDTTKLPIGSSSGLNFDSKCQNTSTACLITNPSQTYNKYWLDADDHTGDGASLMLLLTPTGDGDIFTQYFQVNGDTDYVITFYLLNVLATTDNGTYFGVPNLTLSVNLKAAGGATRSVTTFELGELPQSDHPIWRHFTFTVQTDADVIGLQMTLHDQCNTSYGNDLAIDDISIYRVVDAMTYTYDMGIADFRCDSHTLNFTGNFPEKVDVTVSQSKPGITFVRHYNSCSLNTCDLTIYDPDIQNGTVLSVGLAYVGWTYSTTVTCTFEIDSSTMTTSQTSTESSATTISSITSPTTSASSDTSSTILESTTNALLNMTDLPAAIQQLKEDNVTIDDTTAVLLMTSLSSQQENKNATDITLAQTLNNLGVVMMRSRSSFNISVDGMSLSGVRVNSTGGGLSLGGKTVNVDVTDQALAEFLQGETEANVLLSTTNASLSSDFLYSDVIGLSVMHLDGSEISVNDLKHPIQLTITVLPLSPEESYHCQFYNENDRRWSDANVTTVVKKDGSVICSTNHLTSFSVGVLKPAPVVKPDSESKSVPIGIIVGPAVGGALLLIIVSLVVLFIVLRRKKRAEYATEMEMGVRGQEYEKKTIRVGEQIAGRVYLGHPDTGSFVALKRLSQTDAAKNNRELSAYLKLRHPHIVQFLATYSDDYEYIVLSHMPMGNLHSLVKKGYHGDGLRQIMIDVCSAMRYMEEMQMVHCSLSAC
ncbi:protein kinase, partial [Planoprotostelium fungivorum]